MALPTSIYILRNYFQQSQGRIKKMLNQITLMSVLMIIKINEAEWPFNVIYLGIKSYIINSTFENVAPLVRHSGVKLLRAT